MSKFPGEDNLRHIIEHPLTGILTAATVIRLLGITTRGIQYDDAFSILLAARPINEIIQGTAADTMPPLYYFILHFWQMLGTSIAFQRLPGILFSLGTIVLAFAIVRRLANLPAAIWTASILAVSPLQFYHAQDLRMYSLATLFILGWNLAAIVLAEEETSRKKRIWNWIWLVICGAGALYSHALAGFGLLAPYVYFAWKKDWKKLGSLVLAGLLSIAVYFPWLMVVPGQISKVQQAFWTPRPGVVEILQSVIMILGDIPSPPLVLGIVLFCTISTALFCGIEFFRPGKTNHSLHFFICMALIPPVCLFALSYLMRPMFVPRGFLSAYIGLSACIGILAARSKTLEKFLIGGFILAASAMTLPGQIAFANFPRSPFQSATQYLQSEVQERDIILHDNKLSYFPFEVYAPELNSRFLVDASGSANDTLAVQTQNALHISAETDVGKAIVGAHRVFFVVFQQTIHEYASTGGHPVIQELTGLAGQPVEHSFGDLTLLEYDFMQMPP